MFSFQLSLPETSTALQSRLFCVLTLKKRKGKIGSQCLLSLPVFFQLTHRVLWFCVPAPGGGSEEGKAPQPLKLPSGSFIPEPIGQTAQQHSAALTRCSRPPRSAAAHNVEHGWISLWMRSIQGTATDKSLKQQKGSKTRIPPCWRWRAVSAAERVCGCKQHRLQAPPPRPRRSCQPLVARTPCWLTWQGESTCTPACTQTTEGAVRKQREKKTLCREQPASRRKDNEVASEVVWLPIMPL